MEPKTNHKKILLVLAGILLSIVLIVFLLTRGLSENLDVKPEGSAIDFSTHANIVEGQELLNQIGSLESLELFSQDLHVYGRAAYEPYKTDADRVVGFKATSDIKKEGNKLSFDGRYGSSKNKVSVLIEILNNQRIHVSITDNETQFNIDDSLPSNSKINQFIGRLPIAGDGYDITYTSGDIIGIAIYSRDPEIYNKAYASLVEMLGEEQASELNLSVSLPSPLFGE